MELTLAMMASEATTRLLGVIGFLVLMPAVILAVAFVGRRVVENRHARELPHEVRDDNDDEWLQRTITGGN